MSAQLENGYTRIADEILEKLAKTKLNGTQFRILMVVWRATYGWNKKNHEISESFLAKATGIHKQQIKRELKSLIEKEILIVVKPPTFNQARVIEFNKRYQISSEVTKKIPVNENDTSTVSELVTSTGSELVTQNKDINKQYKNNIYTDIYDYYNSLNLVKHRKLTDSMKKAIKKALKDYTADELKELLQRHATICEITKGNQYPVRKRGLDVFFSQKTNNNAGSPLIYEEYLEGGAKYERYIINKYVDEKETINTNKVGNEALEKAKKFLESRG